MEKPVETDVHSLIWIQAHAVTVRPLVSLPVNGIGKRTHFDRGRPMLQVIAGHHPADSCSGISVFYKCGILAVLRVIGQGAYVVAGRYIVYTLRPMQSVAGIVDRITAVEYQHLVSFAGIRFAHVFYDRSAGHIRQQYIVVGVPIVRNDAKVQRFRPCYGRPPMSHSRCIARCPGTIFYIRFPAHHK